MEHMIRAGAVASVLMLAAFGCKSSREERPAPAPRSPAAAHDAAASAASAGQVAAPTIDARAAVEPEQQPPPTEAADTVLTGDLDGDGTAERIVVGAKQLRIGDAVIDHGLMPSEQARLEIKLVDLNREDDRKELVVIEPWIELEMSTYSFFTYSDGAVVASEPINVPRGTKLEGDGTLVVRRTDCGQTIRTTYRLDGAKVVRGEETKSGTHDPGACMACPYVYVSIGGQQVFVGEILRDLVGADAQSLQRLPLPPAALAHGQVVVRIAERKRETTHIDELYLTVDGQRVRPRSCAADHDGAALCASDDSYEQLSFGDAMDVVFDVKDPPDQARLELWANGYYLPSVSD